MAQDLNKDSVTKYTVNRTKIPYDSWQMKIVIHCLVHLFCMCVQGTCCNFKNVPLFIIKANNEIAGLSLTLRFSILSLLLYFNKELQLEI